MIKIYLILSTIFNFIYIQNATSYNNFAIFWIPQNSNFSLELDSDSPYFIYQQSIIFTNFNTYSSNIIYNQSNGSIIFTNNGTYQISFFLNFNISGSCNVSAGIFISNSNIPCLGAQPLINSSECSGSTIIKVTSGIYINLELFIIPSIQNTCGQVTITPIEGSYAPNTSCALMVVNQIG
jgi:hypothetical protein